MKLYCATGNRGKLREFQLAAATAGIEIDLVPGFRDIPECVEDGATFAENAAKKALYYAAQSRATGPVFADDSGLVVDALNGAPGVYSARFAGPDATDDANNRLLLQKLKGVEQRSARFVCSIVVADGGAVIEEFQGAVEGWILEAARGTGGFGYDPLFYFEPFGCTFGEATAEQKLTVSHRGQAFAAMLRSFGR